METDREEEGLLPRVVLIQELNCFVRVHDVGRSLADWHRTKDVRALAQSLDHFGRGRVVAVVVVVSRHGPEIGLAVLLLGALGWGMPHVFRSRLGRIRRIDLAVVARFMPDLADLGTGVAVLLEMLRQGRVAFRRHEPGLVVEHAGGRGHEAAEDRTARGIAQGKVAVSAVEANAARREPIQVRGLRHWIVIATDAAVEVIYDHEEHVGARLRGECRLKKAE